MEADSISDFVAPNMKAEIADGLLSEGANPLDVRDFCPTDNCTWEQYTSMGVCSSVEDVTPSIVTDREEADGDGFRPGCNYSVPVLKDNQRQFDSTMSSKLSYLWIGASNPAIYNYSALNTLVELYVIYVDSLIALDPEFAWTGFYNNVVALKGTLGLCLYAYDTTVRMEQQRRSKPIR